MQRWLVILFQIILGGFVVVCFILHGWMFAYMCVCVPCVCLVPTEARRGYHIYWDWNYRQLPCGCWELNPGPLQEATSAFNHQAN